MMFLASRSVPLLASSPPSTLLQRFSGIKTASRAVSTTYDNGSEESIDNNSSRPKRIILIRHCESLGNVDDTTYTRMADWKIPLSSKGKQQAQYAGIRLARLMGMGTGGGSRRNHRNEKCFIYYSPYKRTIETMREIVQQLENHHRHTHTSIHDTVIGVREEPRIVEQQFGNFQNYEEISNARDERIKFGRFFYRFPDGESGLDVYNRVSSFISTVARDTKDMQSMKQTVNMDELNLIVVTHGLTLRLFLMRWFQISVDEFESMYNPDNGFLAVMERKSSKCNTKQWYKLTKESATHLRISKRMADVFFEEEEPKFTSRNRQKTDSVVWRT